jgi:hypothetical protein
MQIRPRSVGSQRSWYRFKLYGLAASAGMIGLATPNVRATSYTWTQTGNGPYNWDNASNQDNWGTGQGGAFPNLAGDVATMTTDITANQTINLNQNITIGVLNIGDGNATTGNPGSFSFIIASGSGTKTLTFQSASPGGATIINSNSTGNSNSSINANVSLGGTSPLTINGLGAQTLQTGGSVTTNGNGINVTGGVNQNAVWTVSGDLIGNGVVTVDAAGGVFVYGSKYFTGTIFL